MKKSLFTVTVILSLFSFHVQAEKIGFELTAGGLTVTIFDDRCFGIKYLKLGARKMTMFDKSISKKADGCWWIDEAGLMNVEYPEIPSFERKTISISEFASTDWDQNTKMGREMYRLSHTK